MYTLANTPVFDKDKRPQEQKRRVEKRVCVTEVKVCETSDGDKEEGKSVGVEKGKIESNSLTKLEAILNRNTCIRMGKHT